MAGKIEDARTVAVSLAAATHTKVKKVPIQVTPETEKTNRPEATHSLIVAVGHVIAEKQLTRETVNHPTKTLLQDLREVKIQDLREVKSPRLGRQAKRVRKPKLLDGLDCNWLDSLMLGHILDTNCLRCMAMVPRRLADSIPTKTFSGEVVRPEPD